MHFGRFPADTVSADAPAPLRVARRHFLSWIALSLAAAGTAGWLARERLRGDRTAPAGDADAPPAPRGTLAWALAMRSADPPQLLSAAGDLERVAARHAKDRRLIGVFTRLIDCAVGSSSEVADAAAACAVRALELLDAVDEVRANAGRIAQRRDFVHANQEVQVVTAPPRKAGGK